MKIAVTYDNGEIFQHFGKTESFKVYEVEDNKVVSSEVIGSNGTGHGALAGLLAEQGVNDCKSVSQCYFYDDNGCYRLCYTLVQHSGRT